MRCENVFKDRQRHRAQDYRQTEKRTDRQADRQTGTDTGGWRAYKRVTSTWKRSPDYECRSATYLP